MTTICTDGRIVAADTFADNGRNPLYHCKLHILGDRIMGGAGCVTDVKKFIEWRKDKPKRKPEFVENFNILEVKRTGEFFLWDNQLIECPYEGAFAAVGSGAQAALAAMRCGKDPVGAIYVAMECDNSTRGNVDYVDMRRDPLQIVRIREQMSEEEIDREFQRLIDLGAKGVNL